MKTILLIGIGRFGTHIAKHLSEMDQEIMAIDKDEELINSILPFVTSAQIGDSTNPEFMKSLGVNNYDVCIVAIGDEFQSSLETALLLKELGAKRVIARASTDVQEKFLLRNGADEVVFPEKQLARWTAIYCVANNLLDYIELDDEHAIFEIEVPHEWVGRSVAEIDIRRKHNVSIMAVKKDGELKITIDPNKYFQAGEILMALGKNTDLLKCFKIQ
ncbi:MAG: TrkA family potassium uptake protein [Ruminococcaceae bacterium]|nr:TrkA family potassium uptake protein [Oscillospiraceae bacterium]